MFAVACCGGPLSVHCAVADYFIADLLFVRLLAKGFPKMRIGLQYGPSEFEPEKEVFLSGFSESLIKQNEE